MNAPSLNDLRNAIPVRDLGDEKMNQVRELLIGDFIRASEARTAALEARVRELEMGLGQRLAVLHQRLDAMAADHHQLAADHTSDHQSAFDELAKSVLELGDRIRGIPR